MVRCLPEGEPMLSGCCAVLLQVVLGCADALLLSALCVTTIHAADLVAGHTRCEHDQEQDRCLKILVHYFTSSVMAARISALSRRLLAIDAMSS